MPRRCIDVDVVDADAGATHHPEFGCGSEDLGGDLGLAADDERVVVADALPERGGVESGDDVNLTGSAKTGHAVFSNRVRNEDARHCARSGARLRGDAHPTVTGSA